MMAKNDDILLHAVREGYNRAAELLELCVKADELLHRAGFNIRWQNNTTELKTDMEQWKKDFVAYLKIQTEGMSDAS
jgi:hypothetical protein